MTQTYEESIKDQRVQEIFRGLAQQQSRDDLAKTFGHKSYKTLDIYMRRKGFAWDAREQTYMWKNHEEKESHTAINATKAGKVVMMLQKEGADLRTVAQRLKFNSHIELASYMKSQGYEWNGDQKNYTKIKGRVDQPEPTEEEETEIQGEKGESLDTEQFEYYLPLLKMLDHHQNKLLDFIVPGSETGKIPRYAVPGQPSTKTIQMMSSLKAIVSEFSVDKNISQREIFEVALIEFFEKYGYEHEVRTIIGERGGRH